MYEGPPVPDGEVLSVYIVLNGSLRMSPGKAASQAFHCGVRLMEAIVDSAFGDAVATGQETNAWLGQGRRVVVRVAETPHTFDRVMEECVGIAQQDEGLTEVERGSFTAFVTMPYRRDSIPKILTHKRVQLLRA